MRGRSGGGVNGDEGEREGVEARRRINQLPAICV